MQDLLMAKDKGKKLERNGQSIGQPNATIIKKVNIPGVNPMITTSEPESHSGFIFMCNSSTKLECYQYRVFGLPLGKKEVVEEIQPGAKLFLFDFQLKLLYGIYEATSAGKMNLEPAAFAGKFPAQVKFRIFKECLPMPERILRNIIKENYTGYKFKQELSINQVKNLLSSFRPLPASSSSQPAPHALANVSLSRPMGGSLPAMEVPYSGEMRYNSRVPTFVEPQHVSNTNILPHGYQRTSAVNLSSDLQSLASAISYYVANSQQPAFTEGVAHGVQESSYSRQFHQLPLQREALYQENVAAYNRAAPALYNTSSETQFVASAPYQDTNAASSYTSNPAASSSSQYPAYQDYNAVAYNSNPAASSSSQYPAFQDYNAVAFNSNPAGPLSSQYAASALYQDKNAVAYSCNPAPPSSSQYAAYQDYNAVAYAPSATQPHAGISQGNDPASAYYSCYAANQLSR
ncbi:b2 protein [Phtheirospermum japonicum]|uniref:B2 protein n=1 Tax=Phtheirospermum japonicum TaxID=374723 RepID=A0A830BC06_9LAMI|nr:b2 protein [Phtheirospermum japonicum]